MAEWLNEWMGKIMKDWARDLMFTVASAKWMNTWTSERPALSPVLGVLQRLGPEGAQINSHHLRGVNHLPQWPHEGAVHPHQLLGVHLRAQVRRSRKSDWYRRAAAVDCFLTTTTKPPWSYLVSLVQDDSDLVVLSFEGSDGLGELVRNVQLVGVEQQDDPVHPLPEPTQDLRKVITWGRTHRQKDDQFANGSDSHTRVQLTVVFAIGESVKCRERWKKANGQGDRWPGLSSDVTTQKLKIFTL